MITLAVNGNLAATLQRITIGLREVLGAHELRLQLSIGKVPIKTKARWLKLESARLHVEIQGGGPHLLGLARPDTAVILSQAPESPFPQEVELMLPLFGGQLRAIEALRNDGDLTLRIRLIGSCGSDDGEEPRGPYAEEVRHTVARSDWIAELTTSGASNVVLFEVGLPAFAGSADAQQPYAMLRQAQQHYLNGRYGDAVGKCRLVLEKLGVKSPGLTVALDTSMPQPDRMILFAQVLRHTTHDPHHARPGADQHDFTPAEARMIVQMTAVYAGYCATL